MLSSKASGERLFACLVTAAFLAVVTPVVLHHEMWRDEIQAWLLARDTSLGGLFTALHYEGHPSLWYLTLRLFTPFSPGVRTVQAISLGFGAAAVFLFAWRAPLARTLRVLFAFGYFVAYGYTVLARSYSLEMFLMMLICIFATAPSSRRSRVLLGTSLLLLANTSVYGVILVLAFAGALVTAALLGNNEGASLDSSPNAAAYEASPTRARRLRRILIPLVFAILGSAVALAQIWPRSDSRYYGNGAVTRTATLAASGIASQQASIAYRLTPMWRAFVPIPPADSLGSIWEGDMLLDRSPRAVPVAAVLSITIVVVLTGLLARSMLATTFFGLAVVGNLLFSILVYTGSLYHHGHFYLAFIIALWIAAADPRWYAPGAREWRVTTWLARLRMPIICALLLVQIAGAVVRLVADYRNPFSEGEAVADFIRTNLPPATVVASNPGFNGTTVSGYLGRKVYEIDRSLFATFTPLEVRGPRLAQSQLVQLVRDCCAKVGVPAVLLLDRPLRGEKSPPLLAKFDVSIQPSERYYVYRIDAIVDSTTSGSSVPRRQQ